MSLFLLSTVPAIIYLIILRENLGIIFNIEKILLFFIFGLISTLLILPIEILIFKIFNLNFDYHLLKSFIFSIVEEIIQFLALIFVFNYYKNINIKFIFFAGVTIGTGFLIIENHLYVYEKTINLGPEFAFMRSITSSLMHFFNSIILCGFCSIFYFRSKKMISSSSILIILFVILNHGIYNYVIRIDVLILIIPIILLQLITSLYVLNMLKNYYANN